MSTPAHILRPQRLHRGGGGGRLTFVAFEAAARIPFPQPAPMPCDTTGSGRLPPRAANQVCNTAVLND